MNAHLNNWERIFRKVENLLHYKFRNRSILKEALTIRSKTERTYQRLEFLGDTVLKLVLSLDLFDKYPSWGEGQLTKTRSQLEKNKHLRNIAKAMKLDEIVKPEDGKPFYRYEDLVESLIGAVFKDSGKNWGKIEKLVLEIMDLPVATV